MTLNVNISLINYQVHNFLFSVRLNNLPKIVIIHDESGFIHADDRYLNLVFFSRSLAELYGYSATEQSIKDHSFMGSFIQYKLFNT